jgi:hypothetical protein
MAFSRANIRARQGRPAHTDPGAARAAAAHPPFAVPSMIRTQASRAVGRPAGQPVGRLLSRERAYLTFRGVRMPAQLRASASAFELHRQQWLRDRAAAPTLRSAFPGVERIRVDLTFRDTAALSPGAQSHAVHPSARAFFEFLCPHADCDGTFDLTAAAHSVMTDASSDADGTLDCKGTRPRPGLTRGPCGVSVRYSIVAQHHAPFR